MSGGGAGTPPMLVAGAGIGGLALAAGLRRAGAEVRVFERAPALEPVGAGLLVQPNAVVALRHLGLEEAVRAAAVEVEALLVLDRHGETLSHVDGRALARALGAPLLAMHRAALQAALAGSAGEIETGRPVRGVREEGGEVVVELEGAAMARGSVLAGADGLHSTVRAAVFGERPPCYAGYTTWRGVVDAHTGPLRGRVREFWGRGDRFGIVPVDGGRIYWYATACLPAGGEDPPEGPREPLLARFAAWPGEIGELLRATAPEAILRTDARDRPAPRRLHTGRVALLGDAAHPMTPDVGQGGSQALEDAAVLAAALARHGATPEALARYAAARLPRVRRMVRVSRGFGRLAQLRGPGAAVRDALVRLAPDAALTRAMARGIRLPKRFPEPS